MVLQEIKVASQQFCDSFTENDACAVLCILTHGTETDLIGRDTFRMRKQEIVNILDNCAAMRSKPKVVIIQACRGGKQSYNLNMTYDTFIIPVNSTYSSDFIHFAGKNDLGYLQPAPDPCKPIILYRTFE